MMRSYLRASTSLLLLLAPWIHAQDPGDVPFDTRADAAFGDATQALRELLKDRKVSQTSVQHFCIVGYRGPSGGGERAWVYWTEGREIILWEGATGPRSAATSIARSRTVTDLRKDVVRTEADVKGSTYLVTRAWVKKITTDCDKRGAKYKLARAAR